jgi:lipoprotein-releasing system permease protein
MSRLPFELLLALRYLRPKRTYVSIITLISIIGVTLGVAVLIVVISVMSGFDRQLREKILGFSAHLKVAKVRTGMRDYTGVMSRIAANPLVKGVAPIVIGPVLIETQPASGDPQVMAPWVRGIDPYLESKVSVLPKSMLRGRFDVSGNGVLVGRELARVLGLAVGDHLAIHSPSNFQKMLKSRKQNQEEVFLPDDYEVRGIFDVGYYEYNTSVILCSLINAQDLYDLEDQVHALLVMLHEPDQAEAVRAQLRSFLGEDYSINTWSEDNSGILNALLVEKNVMLYILFFIMIVAAFGITSALITFVVQKTREIGMLKALGATSGQVMWLFLSQSVMVGVLGVLSGFGLGMLALAYRNEFLSVMNRLTGFELFPASIYNFDALPALIMPSDIAIICGGSMLICVLAGLLPAWNAGRLKPVEALRYE